MNHTHSLQADVPPGDGVFLLEVAIGLGEYRLRPEALTWSLTGKDKAKLGIVVACDHEPHPLARFQSLHGVTRDEVDTPSVPDAPVITD